MQRTVGNDNSQAIQLNDTDAFLTTLNVLTKLVDQVEVTISPKSVILRAFDSFDYCYVDAHFYYKRRNLRELSNEDRGEVKNSCPTQYFIIKMEDLSKVLPKITRNAKTQIYLSQEHFIISLHNKKLQTTYFISWIGIAQPTLPTPKNRQYKFEGIIQANDFYSVIASIIQSTNIIRVQTVSETEQLKIVAEAGSLKSETTVNLVSGNGKNLQVKILYHYLKQILRLIKNSDFVHIFTSDDQPTKIALVKNEAFHMNYFFAPERDFSKVENKRKITLPLVNLDIFIEFLIHLYNQPEYKEYVYVLTNSHLETKGGDNSRFGKLLGFTIKKRGMVYLTADGRNFIRNYIEDEDDVKQMIPNIILNKYPQFKILVKEMDFSMPINTTAAYSKFREILRKKYPDVQVKEVDFNTIIKILSWGGMLHFEKGQISEA